MILDSSWCLAAAHTSDLYRYPHEALVLIHLSGSASSQRHHALVDLKEITKKMKNKKILSFSSWIHASDLYNRDQEKNPFFLIFSRIREKFFSSFHILKKNFSSLFFHDENQIYSIFLCWKSYGFLSPRKIQKRDSREEPFFSPLLPFSP